mgnify:CR=1 FL=1
MPNRTVILTFALLLALALHAGAAEKWTGLTTADGLPGNEIQFIKQDDAGRIWIGTDSGLALWKKGELSVLRQKGRAWDVLPLGPDNYWLGTGRGVLRVQGDSEQLHLQGNTVSPIFPYREEVIWALAKHRGTERNAVHQHDEDGWAPVEAFKDMKVADLYRTADGTIWVAEDGDGVHAVAPEIGAEKAVHHLRGLNVTALTRDSEGRVWCGLWNRGVRVLEDGRWDDHLAEEKTYVLGIREDADGTIWVATSSDGLWAWDGEIWTQHMPDAGPINLLQTTSDGRVWVSTQSRGGLQVWDGEKWTVSLRGPLPVRCLLEAKNGRLWAGGILDGIHIRKK